jgi:anaerobic selenocysteine-containing dehydrogenase
VAVLKGINKAVIEAEDRLPGAILDWNFIRGYTSGFEEFVEHIRTVDWLEIEEQSGIALERITEIGSKSEVAIIAGIAEATVGGKGDVKWASFPDYDQIRDRASRIVAGFERFNEHTRNARRILCSCSCETAAVPHGGRQSELHRQSNSIISTRAQYLMMTIRSHDQFNTTIYGLDDRYRGIHGGRRVIFMNRDDIAEARLQDRQLVDLTSHFQGERRTVRHFRVIPYDIPRRGAATY